MRAGARLEKDRPGGRLFCLSSDVLQGLWAQPFSQLSEIEALWRHVRAVRVCNAFREGWLRAERARHRFALADATDHPIHRAGRVLDHEIFRLAIPRHAPAHRPAVAGTHRAAISEVHPAIWDAAVVVEHSSGPALVRLNASVPEKGAME